MCLPTWIWLKILLLYRLALRHSSWESLNFPSNQGMYQDQVQLLNWNSKFKIFLNLDAMSCELLIRICLLPKCFMHSVDIDVCIYCVMYQYCLWLPFKSSFMIYYAFFRQIRWFDPESPDPPLMTKIRLRRSSKKLENQYDVIMALPIRIAYQT